MRVATCVLFLSLLTLQPAAAKLSPAQARPDFSGTWTFDQARSAQPGPDGKITVAAMLGDVCTAQQDAAALTLNIVYGQMKVTAVYKLDGSESRNMAPGAAGQPGIPVTSRASFEGQTLVILSSSVSVLQGKNVTIETKRVFSIDSDGNLIVVRTGTPASEVLPSRSVYRKSK